MEEKTPLAYEVVCFQMLDFGTSESYSEVSKSNSNICLENYFFLENYVTSSEREPFLTMLYTSNSSRMLVTK